MSLATVAAVLQASPKSFDELTTPQQADARASMAPGLQGFDSTQRTWFGSWWLSVNSGQVTSINALLPAKTRVAPLTHNAQTYLSIDLLTDSIDAGNTYHAARTVIRALKCTFLDPPPGA